MSPNLPKGSQYSLNFLTTFLVVVDVTFQEIHLYGPLYLVLSKLPSFTLTFTLTFHYQ